VGDSGLAQVSVLEGDVKGGLGAATVWATSSAPRGIVAADFDGDGYGDLAVSDFTGSAAELLVNDGEMEFQQRQRFAAQSFTTGIAVGDLDGDAHPDLAVTNAQTNADSVTVYRGRSTASLWTNEGNALGGVLGEPELHGAGLLLPGSPVALQLSAAAPSSVTFVVFAGAASFTPLLGGVLVPQPQVIVPLPTNAGGLAGLQGAWPSGQASGASVWMQAWTLDAAAPFSVSASNGLRAQTP
jgi:hypothetical protein